MSRPWPAGPDNARGSGQDQRTLFRLAGRQPAIPEGAGNGKQVADAGDANGDDLLVMAQIYYLQKDCKDSGTWAGQGHRLFQEVGRGAEGDPLPVQAAVAHPMRGRQRGDVTVLVDLINVHDQDETTGTPLLAHRAQDERDDHNLLMINRVMYDTNAWTRVRITWRWRSCWGLRRSPAKRRW